MLAKTVPFKELQTLMKWRADLHVHDQGKLSSSKYRMVRLGNIVIESKKAIEPSKAKTSVFTYIGLENVASITGDLIGLSESTLETVRSRSKIFERGDILYGRLRPYLRKALLVNAPLTQGVCSTEFIVIKAKRESVLPVFLRELLVSDPVTEQLARMQSGAALPRISAKDLLDLQLPLPPIEIQSKIAENIIRAEKQRRALVARLEVLNSEGQRLVSAVFG